MNTFFNVLLNRLGNVLRCPVTSVGNQDNFVILLNSSMSLFQKIEALFQNAKTITCKNHETLDVIMKHNNGQGIEKWSIQVVSQQFDINKFRLVIVGNIIS